MFIDDVYEFEGSRYDIVTMDNDPAKVGIRRDGGKFIIIDKGQFETFNNNLHVVICEDLNRWGPGDFSADISFGSTNPDYVKFQEKL